MSICRKKGLSNEVLCLDVRDEYIKACECEGTLVKHVLHKIARNMQ